MEALDFRRAMRKVDEEFGDSTGGSRSGDPTASRRKASAAARTGCCARTTSWHGFGELAPGFNMLDPIKATVHHAGARRRRRFRRARHPGVDRHQVPRRARHHRREDRALLVLHHVHHRHHQGPLEHDGDRAAAVQGRLRPQPARCGACCPSSCRRIPRYEKIGLRDLCDQIHGIYKANDIARLTTEMYLSNLEPAMKPADAFARMAHREIERVRDRRPRGARHERAAHALSAGHPAADPRRALQPPDRQVPAVRARLQRALPRLRDRHPRAGRGGASAGAAAISSTAWRARR